MHWYRRQFTKMTSNSTGVKMNINHKLEKSYIRQRILSIEQDGSLKNGKRSSITPNLKKGNIYIYAQICTFTYTYVCMYKCTYICTYIHLLTYICINIYVHTHTYVYKELNKLNNSPKKMVYRCKVEESHMAQKHRNIYILSH